MDKINELHKRLGTDAYLHKLGYTFFTIPKLTYKEIKQLIDGDKVLNNKWDEVNG